MNKKVFLVLAAACPLWVFGQSKSLTDSIFKINEVEITAKQKRPLQDQPVDMLNMAVPLKFHEYCNAGRLLTDLNLKRPQARNVQHLPCCDMLTLQGDTVYFGYSHGEILQRNSIRGTSDAVIAYDGIRDERSLTNTIPFGDLSSVESIEVIKGPASILAGHSVMVSYE